MPNHVHFIVEISEETKEDSPQLHGTSRTIGSIVRGYKIGVTKWFREHTDVHTIWQRNYYEHIIRNEKSYHKIVEYIQTNPVYWQEDRYFAENV